MLPGARALRAAGLLRPPGALPRTGAALRARRGPGQRPVGRGFALPAGPDLRHFLRAAAAGQAGPWPELPPEPGSTPGAPKGLWVFGAGAVWVSRTSCCGFSAGSRAVVRPVQTMVFHSRSRVGKMGCLGAFGALRGFDARRSLVLGCNVVCVLPPWSWAESSLLWRLPAACAGLSVGL